MKLFYRLQKAFDALIDGQCVFQNEIGKGKRVYVIGSNKEYWDEYLARGIRYGYECIRKDIPCHLYIDFDVDKKKYPSIKVLEIWQILEKWIDLVLSSEPYLFPESDISKNIQFSSNEHKGSMHVIYKIKNRIFKNNSHVGAFMRCVRELIETESPNDMVMFDEKFVDMSIYSKNRLFRMLGCSKYGQNRYLTNNDPYTYDNWVKTKVQPHIGIPVEYVQIFEPDGSEPSYSGHGSSGNTCSPDDLSHLKPIFEHIEEKFNTTITRYHEFPLRQVVACNLKTKFCNFKGEEHSKNTPFININTQTYRYTVKCHSLKCKHKHVSFEIPDYCIDAMKGITERKCTVPTILV